MSQTTTQILLTRVRERLDDMVQPYLVSDEQILDALNWAQETFCVRTLYLIDTSSFPFSFTANTKWLEPDPQIVKIRRMVCASGDVIRPVTLTTIEQGLITSDYGLRLIENWRTLTGTPRYVVTDLDVNRIRLVPIPVIAASGYYECYRYPEPLTLSGDDPEVPFRWAPVLVAGATMQLFRNPDHDLYDPREADTLEMRFERGLLEAEVAIERERRGPGVTRFNSQSVW